MLRVLLAQAEVELVPAEIAGHPQVRRAADQVGRRPSETLLDANQHHQAMKQLPDGAHRGRPDITHYTLLVLMESPLNLQGRLEVAIHTRDGHLVRIRPDTRLPRGETRFHGLLAKVLRTGASHDKDPLLWVEATCDEREALRRFAGPAGQNGRVVRLDETGPLVAPADLSAQAPVTMVLGAFAHGAFSQGWVDAAPDTVSIWPAPLAAWAVAAEVAAALREPVLHTDQARGKGSATGSPQS